MLELFESHCDADVEDSLQELLEKVSCPACVEGGACAARAWSCLGFENFEMHTKAFYVDLHGMALHGCGSPGCVRHASGIIFGIVQTSNKHLVVATLRNGMQAATPLHQSRASPT